MNTTALKTIVFVGTTLHALTHPLSAQTIFPSQEYILRDSFPRDDVADNGFSSGSFNLVGFDRDSGAEQRGYFEFSLASVAGTVSSATFDLTPGGERLGSYWDLFTYRANNAFDTSNWNVSSTYIGRFDQAGMTIRDTFNVTSAVQTAVTNGDSFIGFRLLGGPSNTDGYISFTGSSFSPQDNTDRPQLTVSTVPEPSVGILCALGLAGSAVFRFRQYRTSRIAVSLSDANTGDDARCLTASRPEAGVNRQ